MRAVVQRVRRASVSVADRGVGQIDSGLLVYLGVGANDTLSDVEYLTAKIAGLRVFEDENGHMNLSASQLGKSILLISQFTLYGDARKGKRPSFAAAMEPVRANELYEEMAAHFRRMGLTCAQGEFGAMMDVESVNDGPVTILLDSARLF
ncbi:MAG: D-tyrosyl-tRNA(Tyr) deacylase [Deltaproteobacteria bacterium]|nr:D-tyrosyl-tRNA(Tyr) deacylase [Deltaproteobacteria bacterium]MBN2673102.1 D-tyrosyl-tRNA(Tyr) deacylase [Deltaproteobacteria bacterium]